MKKLLRGIWRVGQPVLNTHGLDRLKLISAYSRYFREWRSYRAAGGSAPFELLHPTIFDRSPDTQSGGGHYFYQDIWALKALRARTPVIHHDIGSRLDGFVGQATAICPVAFWDIRPPAIDLPDLQFRIGNLLNLPLESESLDSVSCLHTVEHVGLGRYGDPLDPEGTSKAIRELGRVLAPGGQLLLSMPVGRERVCFNAQRVSDPLHAIKLLSDLQLQEFAAVDDQDRFLTGVSPQDFRDSACACGLYRFIRQ